MTKETSNTPEQPKGLSRRTIVQTAAWSAPAIALSAAAPAAAASTPAIPVLTIEFTQWIYTTSPGAWYSNPAVEAVVRDMNGTVANAIVTFKIEDIDSSSGAEGEAGDDNGTVIDPTATFGKGGAVTTTAVTTAGGVATPAIVYVGSGQGVLRVTAVVRTTVNGQAQTATAEAYLRIYDTASTVRLWSAGYGGTGAQGDGSNKNHPIPAAVAMPPYAGAVTLIGAGKYRAGFALDEFGTVWGWGSDYYHIQASRGTKTTPIPFNGLPTDIVQLEGTYYAQFALTSTGEVWGWGYNLDGQFGDGTSNGAYKHVPVRIQNLGVVKKIAGGHYNMFALMEDGTVMTWGYGAYGSNGNGKTGVNRNLTATTMTTFPEGRSVVDIAGRYYGAHAVLDDGTVWSWGANGEGQIGDGTVTHRYVPTQTTGITNAVRVYANYWNVGAVLADGTCRLWGNDGYYNLGNASTVDPRVPINPGLRNVSALSWGLQTGHALLTDGTVYGWGYNGNYETGTGVRGGIKTPTRVPGLGPVKQLVQSQYSTYFLTA